MEKLQISHQTLQEVKATGRPQQNFEEMTVPFTVIQNACGKSPPYY